MAYPISLTSEYGHIFEEFEGTAYIRGLFLLVMEMCLSLGELSYLTGCLGAAACSAGWKGWARRHRLSCIEKGPPFSGLFPHPSREKISFQNVDQLMYC